jgi:hypothetical protein
VIDEYWKHHVKPAVQIDSIYLQGKRAVLTLASKGALDAAHSVDFSV